MNEAASERRLVGVVFISCLLLYLSFRSLYFNFDGSACATAVELSDFKHLVHGNHLVYGVLGWLFDQGWRLLGYGGRAILSLQVLDGILGAAAAAVFASILHRAGRGEREAALGAAALAVSQAWWFWSLEAQVYMLGALFAALSAREALADSPSPERLGLWHAGAVLGHVGHVMALPALIFILTRKRGWASVVPYGGVLAVVADHAVGLGGEPAHVVEVAGVVAVDDVHRQFVFLQHAQRGRRDHVAAVQHRFRAVRPGVLDRRAQDAPVVVGVGEDEDFHS